MKHLLLTTIAAVVLVGCGESQQSATSVKQQPKPLSEADKALLKAANRRNIIYVKRALVDGADVNAKNHIRLTPLHIAADRGHKEVVALLIDKGADVNAMGGEGETPLHKAALVGHNEVVELLIAKGADLSAKSWGETPLDSAIRIGQTETADLLRKHGSKTNEELKAEPVAEATQPEPPTAKAPDISIHKTAIKGNIEAVKQHLAAGTHVNAKDKGGNTPLHLAARFGHKEIDTLANATKNKSMEKSIWGIVNPDDLLAEPNAKQLEAIKRLILEGADVNEKGGYFEQTPLHWAVGNSQKVIVELLLSKGADVNASNKFEANAYSIAEGMASGNENPEDDLKGQELLEIIKKHGGKKQLTGIESAVYFMSIVSGNIETIKKYLADGVDVNAKQDNMTALHKSVSSLQKEVAELLITEGADVNAVNKDGKTPLEFALRANKTDTANMKTAKKEIADLLRKHGGKTQKELEATGK